MKDIANFQDHLECPIVNGIVFADGSIQLLDADLTDPPKITLTSSGKTSIDLLEKKGDLYWNDCVVLTNCIDLEKVRPLDRPRLN